MTNVAVIRASLFGEFWESGDPILAVIIVKIMKLVTFAVLTCR